MEARVERHAGGGNLLAGPRGRGVRLFFDLRADGVTAGPPQREAPCLARQIVQRAAERLEAQRQPPCVDRVAGQGRVAVAGAAGLLGAG